MADLIAPLLPQELGTNEQKAVGGVYGGHQNKSADEEAEASK